MKFKYKTKKLFKNISLGLLGLGAVGAIGVGATKIVEHAKNDLETIHPTFEVGGLGEDGKYVKDELSLYTKDDFACEGLQATLDFDSDISYQFFFYDDLHEFISSSDVMTSGTKADIPSYAAYARVEITPLNDEDGKISLKERVTYPSQLNLKVSKKAESNVKKLFVSIGDNKFRVVTNPSDSVFELNKSWNSSEEKFNVTEDFCATTTTILEIGNNRYLKLNSSVYGEDTAPEINLFQYKMVDGKLVFNGHVKGNSDSNFIATFDKDTDYVVMTYWSNSENLSNFYVNVGNGIILSNVAFK